MVLRSHRSRSKSTQVTFYARFWLNKYEHCTFLRMRTMYDRKISAFTVVCASGPIANGPYTGTLPFPTNCLKPFHLKLFVSIGQNVDLCQDLTHFISISQILNKVENQINKPTLQVSNNVGRYKSPPSRPPRG